MSSVPSRPDDFRVAPIKRLRKRSGPQPTQLILNFKFLILNKDEWKLTKLVERDLSGKEPANLWNVERRE